MPVTVSSLIWVVSSASNPTLTAYYQKRAVASATAPFFVVFVVFVGWFCGGNFLQEVPPAPPPLKNFYRLEPPL